MRRCPICLGEENDGRVYIQETYCKKCLQSDIHTLRFIHLRSLNKKEAPCNPAKDQQEA